MTGWADRFKICKIVRRYSVAIAGSGPGPSSATSSLRKGSHFLGVSVLGALGDTVGGNFVSASDKKDLGTHVEISK